MPGAGSAGRREKVRRLPSFLRPSCLSVSASLVISVLPAVCKGSWGDLRRRLSSQGKVRKGLAVHSEGQKHVTQYHGLSTEASQSGGAEQ